MIVTRYELTTKYRGNESWDELEENPEGAYVRYGDYAALEQRLIESERYGRQTDITIDNLELKLAQMAAENAGLIEQAEEVYAAGYNHGHLNTVDGIAYADCVKDDFYGLAVELMCEAETPATDVYLAEVRAQGVEQLAKAWYAIANETDPGISISESSRLKYRQRADDAADFANEIRQEAAR